MSGVAPVLRTCENDVIASATVVATSWASDARGIPRPLLNSATS